MPGRVDDNEESIRKRFNTYHNETMPVIKYFEGKGLVRRIDATAEPQKVFEDVQKVIS